jgi:septum site-determining protein MinD
MILAVAGGKGGVGKTTVALNLGVALEAVVVDADLTMANLPTYGARGPDLHDVLAGRAAPVEAVREGDPVAVLPCGRTLAGARAADPAALVAALDRVEAAYGDLVVDCPAGMRADAGLPLHAAGACVPVTTPDRPALADAVRTRELARELEAPVVRTVLNRVRGDPSIRPVADAVGSPVVAIPESDRVAAATATGRPVAPDSPAGERFRALADAVYACRSA